MFLNSINLKVHGHWKEYMAVNIMTFLFYQPSSINTVGSPKKFYWTFDVHLIRNLWKSQPCYISEKKIQQ